MIRNPSWWLRAVPLLRTGRSTAVLVPRERARAHAMKMCFSASAVPCLLKRALMHLCECPVHPCRALLESLLEGTCGHCHVPRRGAANSVQAPYVQRRSSKGQCKR